MRSASIYFMLFLIIAIFIEYFLFNRWQRYKKLSSANNSGSLSDENPALLKKAFLDEHSEFFTASVKSILEKFGRWQLLYFIILAVIGIIQIETYIFESYLWVGGLIYLFLALLGFTRNIKFLENITPLDQQNPDESPSLDKKWAANDSNTTSGYAKYLWIVVFILLAFTIFTITSPTRGPAEEWAGTVTWIASVLLGLIIVLWRQTCYENTTSPKIKAKPGEILFLIILIVLSFFLRTFLLAEHPYPLSGDEASIAIVSRQILHGEIRNFFGTAWASQTVWSFLPTSLAIKILGDNIVGIRAASVIVGTLAVLFTYLAAREMFNTTIAIISAAFLATLPYNVHFSRVGVNNIMDSLMSPLVFWLISRSVRTHDPRLCYLAGTFGGLCFYTYTGTKLVPILGVIILLLFLYHQEEASPRRSKYILYFMVALAISAAPQMASLTQDRNLLLDRLSQEGILFNGWLTEQMVFQEISIIEIIWNQLTRSFLAFIALPASGIFYYSPKPYLTIAASIFFLFGISYSWIQRRKPEYFSLLMWYLTVVFLGGVLTQDPPATTRMLMTTPAVAILVGIGIYQIIKQLTYHGILFGPRLIFTTFAIIALLSIQNIYFYMVEFKNNSYFQDASGEFAMEAGGMIKNLGDEYQVFIIGEPMVFSDFPTFRYLVPNNQIMNLNDKSVEELHLIKYQKYVFFAIPENHALLEKIMDRHKGGQSGIFIRKTSQRPTLFEYYILDTYN